MKPFLLSHHPDCDKFAINHTINVGKYRFCIGCFVGYPTAIIGILAFYFLNLVNLLDSLFLLVIALILLATFFLSPLNLTKIKTIKIIQKFLINIYSELNNKIHHYHPPSIPKYYTHCPPPPPQYYLHKEYLHSLDKNMDVNHRYNDYKNDI